MRLVTGRDRVGWPTTTTRSTSPRRSVVSSSRPVRSACRPIRAPDVGSATSGQLAASASRRAAGPASSPATTTVRGPSGSTSPSVGTDTDGSSVPVPARRRGRQPCAGSVGVAESSGRGWRSAVAGWRCGRSRGADAAQSGLGALPPRVAVGVRRQQVAVELDVELGRAAPRARLRHEQPPSSSSGVAAVRSWHGAKIPKMPAWSVVWLAPVPRSRSGRSALTTTTPTPCVVRLHDRRQQVADGRARRRDDGDRSARPGRQTEREEARRPLVDAHVQAQVAVAGRPRRARGRRGPTASPGASTTSRTPPSHSCCSTCSASSGALRRAVTVAPVSRSRARRASG